MAGEVKVNRGNRNVVTGDPAAIRILISFIETHFSRHPIVGIIPWVDPLVERFHDSGFPLAGHGHSLDFWSGYCRHIDVQRHSLW